MMLPHIHKAKTSAFYFESRSMLRQNFTRYAKYCFSFALALCGVTAHALPDDSSQPVQVVADKAERNAKTGITVYTGNVDIKQGSLQINADVVTIKMDKNEVVLITATGNLAHYQQEMTSSEDVVKAKGKQINYHVPDELMLLDGNASLEQKGSSIQGEHVEYDVRTEKVKAHAAENGAANNSKRVMVVIPPSKNEKTPPAAKSVPAIPASGKPAQ